MERPGGVLRERGCFEIIDGGGEGEGGAIAGNSLGGKLALYVAATSEDITDGIILLNATPFWGFLEKRVRFLTKENEFIVKLTQPYWDNFRSKENVRRLLTLVYADKTKIEESLIENIIEPTENEFAIRAFISTFTSPKASRLSYDEMLETIRDRNESMFLKSLCVTVERTRGWCLCGDSV